MPPIDPISLPGIVLDAFPDQLSQSNGSVVTSAFGMTVPSGYTGPTLTHNAANGRKALTFTGVECLAKDFGGSNYRENTVYIVAEATSLAISGSFPTDRRVAAGLLSQSATGGTGHFGLWADG